MSPSYSQGEGFSDGERWAAAWIPTSEWTNNPKHVLSANGNRFFFMSFDALSPGDVNEAQDVYQWEAPGEGGCDSEDPEYFAENGGCVALISTGRSQEESEFLPPRPPAPPCVGDACQIVPAAPEDPTPASSSYQGSGNAGEAAARPSRCPKGSRRVSRKGKSRCARKHRPRHRRGSGR
jgi:hypothetical protein